MQGTAPSDALEYVAANSVIKKAANQALHAATHPCTVLSFTFRSVAKDVMSE
jgi:hypothetical protein